MDYSRLFFELFNYFSFTFNPNPPLIWKLPLKLLLFNLKLFVSMESGRSMKLLRMILLPLSFWSLNKLAKRQVDKFCNFHSRLPSEDAPTKNALSWRHHAHRPGKGAPARTAGANAKHSDAQETRRRAHPHLRSRSSLSHTHKIKQCGSITWHAQNPNTLFT